MEALDIADAAGAAGSERAVDRRDGDLRRFRAGHRHRSARTGLGLRVGPLPVSVRTPVAIALGASSVASLTGCDVDVALGASSPFIVAGWHDRDWSHSAARMRETIECLRPILRGERGDYDGRYVQQPWISAAEPVAAQPHRSRRVRPDDDAARGASSPTRWCSILLRRNGSRRSANRSRRDAAAAGRTPPHLTVWVPVAVRPGEAALRQLAGQLAVYLAPPGYGEMFCELGFAELVERARGGARRSDIGRGDSARIGRAAGRIRYSGTSRRPDSGPICRPAPTPSR